MNCYRPLNRWAKSLSFALLALHVHLVFIYFPEIKGIQKTHLNVEVYYLIKQASCQNKSYNFVLLVRFIAKRSYIFISLYFYIYNCFDLV